MSATNNPYLYGIGGCRANRRHGPSQNNVQRVSKTAYGRASAPPYNLAALPPQEFAQRNWPPSVYQAAQYNYYVPLTLRQRYSGVTEPSASTRELWPTTQTGTTLSYHNRSPSPTLPQIADSQHLYDQDLYTMTDYIDTSQHSPLDPNFFTETLEDPYGHVPLRPRSPRTRRSKSEGADVQDLHCSQCDNTFTGNYARRNYNRHMEGHNDPKSIHCNKPECVKTFRRKDALLVHVRRSHPELAIPPAKKRKNGNLAWEYT